MKYIGRQSRTIMLKGICVFLIALSLQPNPVSAQNTAITVNFNSLPSTQPGWFYSDDDIPHLSTPEATYFSTVGNLLHMDTRGRNGDGTYGYRYPILPDPNQPFSMTIIARVTGNSKWSPSGFSAYVGFPDEAFDIALATGPNTIAAGSGGKVFSTSIDTTQFHEYRIEGVHGGKFELFVDNVSLGFGDPWSETETPQLFFGDGTRGGDAVGDFASFSFTQTQPVVGTDPGLSGCYVYTPDQVNEGQTFTSDIKCHGIASNAYGFQFGTTFTPSQVTRNGIPNTAVAEQLGTTYTAGDFAPTNALVGMNSLSSLYAISHEGTDVSTGDFTLGSFDSTVPMGITADSSATVDLRDLKLSDRLGADIPALLPHSQATVTIKNLFIALRSGGTIHVQSDGTMTNIRAVQLNLDDGIPYNVSTASGSFNDFSVPGYRYPDGKQSADISLSMTSHLSCTKNIPLLDGLNAASVFGTSYTLKAGDANSDSNIDISDATLVGGYFGTSRTDGSDINGDGSVNIYDLVHIGRNYGASSGTCS